MALKRSFTDSERYGLTQEEVKLGEKYLRKNKTAGAIPELESMKLYELYMIGASFNELHAQFPQYNIDRIILTAALRGWAHDRDNAMHSLRERVRAKVVKSVIEQVDFLTSMLSVSNAEHMMAMQRYILDPINNPKPPLRIENIKEYKDVAETLYKIVAGSTGGTKEKTSPMFDALTAANNKKLEEKEKPKELTAAEIIAEQVNE